MKNVKILLVEDQLVISRSIQAMLKKEGYILTDCIISGEEALESIKKNLPDLVLMDIHLKGEMNGIQTARSIMKNYHIPVIYITQDDSNDMYQDAIQTFPINYITKPFTENTLLRAIFTSVQYLKNNTLQPARQREEVFIYTSPGVYKKIKLSDIIYLEASGAYTNMYVSGEHSEKNKTSARNNFIKIARSSNKVTEQLNSSLLIQVHRSYFININKVDHYNIRKVFVEGNEIPVSKTYRAELERKLSFLAG